MFKFTPVNLDVVAFWYGSWDINWKLIIIQGRFLQLDNLVI